MRPKPATPKTTVKWRCFTVLLPVITGLASGQAREMEPGEGAENPFIDPAGFQTHIDEKEKSFKNPSRTISPGSSRSSSFEILWGRQDYLRHVES